MTYGDDLSFATYKTSTKTDVLSDDVPGGGGAKGEVRVSRPVRTKSHQNESRFLSDDGIRF